MQTIVEGVRIGQYVIRGKLGAGTMGVVYAAEQPSMKRLVAIKFLPEEAAQLDAVQRFRREARMIARLEHPFVLPVYDFGHYEGNPYIVMRYMTGGTLLDRMAAGMSSASALRVLEQVARALDYAHRLGIIHRDLKPTNVFMDERGNAYLADFGLAKTLAGTEDLTTTAQGFAGTPLYISPEQAGGDKLDHKTDIYSLAVIAYEMLAGQPPYDEDTPLGIIMKHITAPVPSISGTKPAIPPEVDVVFAWALAKDPAERPATASAFVDALRLALPDAAANPDAETLRPAPAGAKTSIRATTPGVTRPAAAGESATDTARAPAGQGRAARRRWRGVALAAALLLLAALLWRWPVLFEPGGVLSATQVYTYPVGLSPRALLYDGQSVWVVNTLDNQVTRLAAGDCDDAATPCGRALATYEAPGTPLDIALAGDSVWIITGLSDALLQLDATTGELEAEHLLPRLPNQLLAAHGFLWVSHTAAGLVSQVAPDGTIVRQYQVGGSPRAMVADETAVWVADEGDNKLSRLVPATGQVALTLTVPGRPLALTYGNGFLWVALVDNTVARVNPVDGAVEARLRAGERPAALLLAGDKLWVANQNSSTVMAIDLVREEAGRPIAVGDAPLALAWSPCGEDCGDLWVANEADNTVSRVRLP